MYDNEDNVCGICYNGTSYYFVKNLQGDVISLVVKTKMDEESRYVVVANYTYDAWGKCTVKNADGVVKTASDFVGNINPYRYRGYYYDVETGLYYLQSRYYDPEVGRFINGDEFAYLFSSKNVTGLNFYSYCLNCAVNMFDPFGMWVLAVGIEGQAAFILGAYAGFSINLDETLNISITYSIGFAVITNAAAYIQAYVALYSGKNRVSQLKGWGISVGASFSVGAHMSGGGTLDVGFDSSIGSNVNVGYGVGVSAAPVPYFQTKIGYTGTIVTFNLLSVLNSWADKKKKRYSILVSYVEIKKYNGYIKIYIKPLKKTIYIYKNYKIKIK